MTALGGGPLMDGSFPAGAVAGFPQITPAEMLAAGRTHRWPSDVAERSTSSGGHRRLRFSAARHRGGAPVSSAGQSGRRKPRQRQYHDHGSGQQPDPHWPVADDRGRKIATDDSKGDGDQNCQRALSSTVAIRIRGARE